jgi:SAM-dependent methyltransferase
MLRRDRDIIARLWGHAARARAEGDGWKLRSWDSHPVTYAYINRRITGDPNEHWLDFVKRRFVPAGAPRGLSLACGSGSLERHALRIGLCRSMDGCDLSTEALAVAGQLAEQESFLDRVRYFQCDLNSALLDAGSYDICFSGSAIHHVANLEHALAQIRLALRPGGLFVLVEYVGPNRFQWSGHVQDLMNELLITLPESYRRRIDQPRIVKRTIERPSAEAVAADDPSEAIRSEEILAQLDRSFEVVYRADVGGTLLQFLLADIVGNFNARDPADRAILERLVLFEETCITQGSIPSDFVMLVVRPD